MKVALTNGMVTALKNTPYSSSKISIRSIPLIVPALLGETARMSKKSEATVQAEAVLELNAFICLINLENKDSSYLIISFTFLDYLCLFCC